VSALISRPGRRRPDCRDLFGWDHLSVTSTCRRPA